jgi:hypothetical protein
MTNKENISITVEAYKKGSNDVIKLIIEFLNNISKKQEETFKELLSNTNIKD